MRRQALPALVLIPVLALGASSCGRADGTGAKATATRDAAADDAAKMREYAKCMRANGVDMPDPTEQDGKITVQRRASGGKAGEQRDRAAERKCRHLMPNGGKPVQPKPEELAKMRAMAKCMRANGVPEFPDPEPGGGFKAEGGKGKDEGPSLSGPGGLNPESPAFKAAERKCRHLGPGPAKGRGER